MGGLAKGFPKAATYKVETMTGSTIDSTADFNTVWEAIDNMYDVLPAAGKTKNLHIHPDNGPCDRTVFTINESGTVTLNNISNYFRIYDVMPTGAAYRNGIATTYPGFEDGGNIEKNSGLWPGGATAGSWAEFDEATFRAKMVSISDNGKPFTIDVEGDDPDFTSGNNYWEIDNTRASNTEVAEYISHWDEMFGYMKDEMTQRADYRPFGAFRVPVIRDYFAIYNHLNNTADSGFKATFDAHLASVMFNRSMPKNADFVAPALYAFYPTSSGGQTGYNLFAREQIRWSNLYGKPVIPYVWRKFHQGGDADYQYLSTSYTKDMIKICLEEGCVGVFVWDNTEVAPPSGADPNTIDENLDLINFCLRYTGQE